MHGNLPDFTLDNDIVQSILLKGAGGKEDVLATMFARGTDVKRINHPLYDFHVNNYKVECKRQTATNWFDYAKYYNLSEDDRQIVMLFIIHKGGVIRKIVGVSLGQFITLACADARCQKDGRSHSRRSSDQIQIQSIGIQSSTTCAKFCR